VALRSAYTVLLLCLINALSYIDRSALALVLPQLKAELHLSDTVLGLVSGLPFALCYAACALPSAWLADNTSRRRLLAVALALWSTCTAATAAIQSGLQLSVARFFLGATESVGLPASTSLIADLCNLKWRPIAFSTLAASVYVGPLLAFPLLGWITSTYGWRSAFMVAGLPGIFIALVFYITVRDPRRTQLTSAKSAVSTSNIKTSLAELWLTPSYRLIVLAGCLSAVNFGSMLSWGPTQLARIRHLDPVQTAYYFGTVRGAAGLAGALLAGLVIGVLARRDARWLVRIPVVLLLCLFASDATFLLNPSPAMWQLGLAASAFCTAAIVAASYTLYVSVAATHSRATATAIYLFFASITGQTLGPFLVGAVSDLLTDKQGTVAISHAMLIASFISVPSAIALWLAGRNWQKDVQRIQQSELATQGLP
jgi:MFS family permease